jgi:hypothetical protein
MASRQRPTANKRARERARQQKQQEKQARRLEAKAQRVNRPAQAGEEDPDLAGIKAGPQPKQDWQLEDQEAE